MDETIQKSGENPDRKKEGFFERTNRERREHLIYAKKKYGEYMTREKLDEYLKNEDPAPNITFFFKGKSVWPTNREYDAYTSVTGEGILNYGNGKFACHTDCKDLKYKLDF